MQDLFSPDGGCVLVFGVGALGCRVASRGAADSSLRALWCGAHAERSELISSGLENKLHLPFSAGPFARMAVERALSTNQEKVAGLAAGRSTAILLGGSDATSALLMTGLASALQECGLYTILIAAEPPLSEETGSNAADLTILLPLESQPDLSLRSIESAAEETLLAVVETLLGALNAADEALTPELLRKTFRGPVHAAIHTSRGGPLAALDAALEKLSGSEPLAAIFNSARDLTFAETQQAAQRMNTKCRAPLLFFSRQPHAGPETVCLVLAQTTLTPVRNGAASKDRFLPV